MTQQFQYHQKVETPFGPGRVDGVMLDDQGKVTTKLQIVLCRVWYTPEQWAELCPGNGPTVFKAIETSELKPVTAEFPAVGLVKGHSATWTEVTAGVEEQLKRRPRKLDMTPHKVATTEELIAKATVGSIWRSHRKGDLYQVLERSDKTIKILWLGDRKYKRDVNPDGLVRHYDYVAASEEEVPNGSDGAEIEVISESTPEPVE